MVETLLKTFYSTVGGIVAGQYMGSCISAAYGKKNVTVETSLLLLPGYLLIELLYGFAHRPIFLIVFFLFLFPYIAHRFTA